MSDPLYKKRGCVHACNEVIFKTLQLDIVGLHFLLKVAK